MKPWLTVGEGADYANVSRDTIYTGGQGPRFLRIGRAVRYLPGDLEDFVRASAGEGDCGVPA